MLRCLAVLIAVVTCLPAVSSGHAEDQKSPRPKNIVFILADDLGWAEAGCYGQKLIPTPNIDRLAREGSRFTRFYSGAPVCAPSRCVLMTGKHLGHAEVRGNQQAKVRFPQFTEGQTPLSPEAVTFPMLFQKAGYKTAAMGKWGLGPVGSTGEPNRKGFDLFFGYNCQAVAHSYFPESLWRNDQKVLINPQPIPGASRQPEGPVTAEDWQARQYAPALMVTEAQRFIRQNAEVPFLLYLPFIEPHVSLQPPPELVNQFPTEWDEQVYRGENGYLPHPRPRAAYAAMIADLDRHVGHVLSALEQAGLLDQTLIIFTSDNGATHPGKGTNHFHVGGADPKFFNSTADLRGYKGSVYEGGIRVPMIARLPGVIPADHVNGSPGYFADWFPTLCEAAGLETPAGLDGESLWGAITSGKTEPHKKPMLWVFPEYGGQVAIQIGDLKLVRQNLKTRNPGPWEVYDLSRDRSEKNDLAGSHPDLIAQAEALLKQEVSPNEIFPLPIPPAH